MKNVNPKKVFSLLAMLSVLIKQKFTDNDLGFFKRFESFIEQESLSDQRFSINSKYTLEIPNDYSIINNSKLYQEFLQKWNPGNRNGTSLESLNNFEDENFEGCKRLIPGKNYIVTEYKIKYDDTPLEECLEFLKKEDAGLYGLQGLLTILDLDKDKISFKEKGAVSVNPVIFKKKNFFFFAERILSIKIGYLKYISAGSILLTFKEKK